MAMDEAAIGLRVVDLMMSPDRCRINFVPSLVAKLEYGCLD